jgi:hypothetical protein
MENNWYIKYLNEICKIKNGKHDANHAKENGKYRFFTCSEYFSFCDTKGFEGESIILPGNGVNVGKVFYYNGAFDAYQRTYVLNNIEIIPKFLFYYLKAFWEIENIDKQYGSATNYIRMSNFTNFKIVFPPNKQQHRIVAKIEELFSELDNGVANLEKTKEQLQTYRQSVLKHAFEGRLTENWRAYNPAQSRHAFKAETGHKAAEPQRVYQKTAQATASNDISQETLENLPGPELLQHIKAERQRQYEQELKEWEQKAKAAKAKGQKKPAKPKKPKEMDPLTEEEIQQLPELPAWWCWVKVGEISEEVLGGGTPSTKVESYWNGQIPWITSADIKGVKTIEPRKYITKEAINNSATNFLPKNNIVIVTRVGLGKLAINDFDLCFSQDSQGLIPNENLDKVFLL